MRIAYITSRFPYPVEKGDKLRAYHQIKGLSVNHDVHLFAITVERPREHDIAELERYCASVSIFRISRFRSILNLFLGLLRGLPGQVSLFFDARTKRKMQAEIVVLQPDHIIAQLIRTSEYVRKMPFKKSIDYMDTFSVGTAQRKANAMFLLKPMLAWEESLVKKYERRIYGEFDRHTIISVQDRDRLPLPYPQSVRVIGNGVDTEYYSHNHTTEKKWDVLFVGNMGYAPNIEAAVFLVKHVMPVVWNVRPEATVCLAGARPSSLVSRLANERVIVTGWVEDIRKYYAQGKVFVAPMFSGMGMQNKILEAMSMELPCVTTAIVNNAIGAEPGVELEVANSALETGRQINRLLDSDKIRSGLGKEARHFVRGKYTWEAQNKKLNAVITFTEQSIAQEVQV